MLFAVKLEKKQFELFVDVVAVVLLFGVGLVWRQLESAEVWNLFEEFEVAVVVEGVPGFDEEGVFVEGEVEVGVGDGTLEFNAFHAETDFVVNNLFTKLLIFLRMLIHTIRICLHIDPNILKSHH